MAGTLPSVFQVALFVTLAPCRLDAAYCPPLGAGPCLLHPEASGSKFLIAEKRLASALDFLLEVHDFHCGDRGREAVKATFAWFEDLRLAGCALRFHTCPSMDDLFQAECRRADASREELEALIPDVFQQSSDRPRFSTCADFAGAVLDAAMTGVKLGQQLPLGTTPCPVQFSGDGASSLLLYPAHRSPNGICQVDDLLFPQKGSSAVPASWRDITGHLARGKFLGFDEAFHVLRHIKSNPLIGGNGTAAGMWVVNLGANDGACEAGAHFDPANCLLFQGSGDLLGVLVESDPKVFRALEARAASQRPEASDPWSRHRLVHAFVTPETVVEVIAAELPTAEPFLIKVDVDNADCTLVRQMLEVFSPLFVHAEINPLVPPPIVFRSTFDTQVAALDEAGRSQRLQQSHAGGCSLAALLEDANARRPRGAGPRAPAGEQRYAVLHVDFANAALVRTDVLAALRAALGQGWASTLAASAEAKWRAGYLCHPLARHLYGLEWGARCDVRALADPREPVERRAELARAWLGQVAGDVESGAGYELYVASGWTG